MAVDPNDPNSAYPQPTQPGDAPVNGKATDLNQGVGEDGFSRHAALLDPQKFKKKYLFGVPLRAALTGETIDIDDLKEYIYDAVQEFEMQVRIPVSPVRQTDKFDYVQADEMQFSTRQTTRWPILEVEALWALWPGRQEGSELPYPTGWVSIQGDQGLFSIVPNSADLTNADTQFLASIPYRALGLGNVQQWPNMWRIQYKAGFDHDKIPHAVNHLIGVMAAINFLSIMGPAIFPMNSVSVSVDGVAQGTGSPGPQWLAGRIADLTAERDRLIPMMKSHYGTDMQMKVF